jgi:hypothetical protein
MGGVEFDLGDGGVGGLAGVEEEDGDRDDDEHGGSDEDGGKIAAFFGGSEVEVSHGEDRIQGEAGNRE